MQGAEGKARKTAGSQQQAANVGPLAIGLRITGEGSREQADDSEQKDGY